MSKLLDLARNEADRAEATCQAGDRYDNGYLSAWDDAVALIEEHEQDKRLKISDEVNELLLDSREAIGFLLDGARTTTEERYLRLVFADIQKAIKLTKPIELTEEQEKTYQYMVENYNECCIQEPKALDNVSWVIRMALNKYSCDDECLLPLQKFLNEVAE